MSISPIAGKSRPLFFFTENIFNITRGLLIKLLPGLLAFFFLTTVVYAAATSIGFDKPEYQIPPGHNQQIYAQLRDATGQVVKAESTTYVYIYPGSTSARVSSAISTPSFSATAKLTIAKGTTQRSFLYQDNTLGTSYLSATSSGLLGGNLKITIGFPPPPPPPPPVVLPPPSPIKVVPVEIAKSSEVAVVSVREDPGQSLGTISPAQPPDEIVSKPTTAPETIPMTKPQNPSPAVLAEATDRYSDRQFVFLDQIVSWFRQFISDNIGL